MSAFLGPKGHPDSRLFPDHDDPPVPSELDQFVINRKLENTRQRLDRAPRADREDLLEALQELGTALRKERSIAQELRSKLERASSTHSKQVEQLQLQLQAAAEKEQKSRESQLLSEKKEKEHEERISAIQTEKEQLKAQLARLEQDRGEETRKLRFELEMMRAGLQHQSTASEQLRRVLTETRAHYDRLRSQVERAVQAYRESEQRRRELENRARAMANELAGSRDALAKMQGAIQKAKELSDRANQERNEAAIQLQKTKERSVEQSRRWTTERARLQDLESSIESERNEKHMVLTCLRTAEAKLGQKDEQISHLTKELEALRAARPTAIPPASVKMADPLSAEEAQKLCDRYFVAYPVVD